MPPHECDKPQFWNTWPYWRVLCISLLSWAHRERCWMPQGKLSLWFFCVIVPNLPQQVGASALFFLYWLSIDQECMSSLASCLLLWHFVQTQTEYFINFFPGFQNTLSHTLLYLVSNQLLHNKKKKKLLVTNLAGNVNMSYLNSDTQTLTYHSDLTVELETMRAFAVIMPFEWLSDWREVIDEAQGIVVMWKIPPTAPSHQQLLFIYVDITFAFTLSLICH